MSENSENSTGLDAKPFNFMSSQPISAKTFKHGGSQALRLPKQISYPDDVNELLVRRDPLTGDLIVSNKPSNWQGLFKFLDELASKNHQAGQAALPLGAGPQ